MMFVEVEEQGYQRKLTAMKIRSLSLPTAAIAVASSAVIVVLSGMALGAAAAVVEHTFIVSQMYMRHLCKETLVTVVNGQFPGPAIEVNEGDSVVVHVVNKSPHNITIHWHGVKQQRNCWADGVPMITQFPIEPKKNLTYRFDVTGQEGTLWWHAHAFSLRGTLHGALIIRPRHGAAYPFLKPHKEIPVVIGEWWEKDLEQLGRDFENGVDQLAHPSGATINGKLGDTFNCSGAVEDGYVLDVEPGKTYLLRVINAALFAEYYLRIAGHKFMVVAADANYVKPYLTDTLTISPGETVDALVVMNNATPGSYYMVAKPNRAPLPDPQIPIFATRGLVQYKEAEVEGDASSSSSNVVVPVVPDMPDQYDTLTSLYFHGNLTALYRPHQPLQQVPTQVDERMFIALGGGNLCRRRGSSSSSSQMILSGSSKEECMAVVTMNNVSYHLPADSVTVPLLEAQYCHRSWAAMGGVDLSTLPARPPKVYNFTDRALTPFGPAERQLEATRRATMARRFRYGSVVEIVFQSCALLQSDANPMHLHGHDMFVLAQGLGNYDEARDVARYNLVDPPVRNTVLVPRLGWVAIRFVANNPGVWFMHCHFDFHLSMGMAALFIVEDGQTVATSLPPPPDDFLTCGHGKNLVSAEIYPETKESLGPQIN